MTGRGVTGLGVTAPVTVRPARPGEAPLVTELVAELAAYERLAHEAAATPQDFDAALFGPAPRAFCDLAEVDGAPVGLALWFYNFSTFTGRHGLYLEDLYVRPQARGRGAGRALLQGLARRCVAEGLTRLEWSVLDWNAPAQAFYAALGARPMEGWTVNRLAGEALSALAARREPAAA